MTRKVVAALAVALVVLGGAGVARAAYLEDVPQEVVQPDGSVLHFLASGDEFYHWAHDSEGFVIVRDAATGWAVYADLRNGELVPTACRAGACDPAGFGLRPRLKPAPAALARRAARFAAAPMEAARPEGAPTYSLINNLVVFVRFSGDPEFSGTLSYYQTLHNATTGNSMYAYFREASYNQTTISSTFYPTPSGNTVLSYQDVNPRSYYQPYNVATNPGGYNGDDEATAREHALVKRACDAIASQVPLSLNLDTDSDGRVDNVSLVVKGSPDSWSDLLWPHRWSLYTEYATINGFRVWAYNFQLETRVDTGVLCHEMSHSLGAPDLYHYDNCSAMPDLSPVSRWDLMASSRNPPQHSGAYMKQTFLGWIGSIPAITASGTYTLNPMTSPTNNAYRIASPNSSNEYFVVEYRRQAGTFESSLPGSGLIVYRINPNANSLRRGNPCGPPDEVYVYRPGGTPGVDGSPLSAAMSATAGRTAINDSTDPSSFLADGSPGGLNISNVGAAGDTISFQVTIGGSACTYSLSQSSASMPAGGGSGSVTVTTAGGCVWNAAADDGWITVTGGASGSGSGTVFYSVAANAGGARTGTMTIAGQMFTVNQAGGGCQAPVITQQPFGQGVASGQTATLAVVASGDAPLSYQWYRGWNGDTSNSIPGATGASYTTPAMTATTAFWVRVSNGCGSTDSSSAVVTVSGGGGEGVTWYVPAIAHNPGAGGTAWRSDLAVVNTGAADASFTLTFYSGSSPMVQNRTLPGRGTAKWVNVLESLFGVGASVSTQGTVVVTSTAPLAITARTYNQAASGTYGQYYPAVRSGSLLGTGQVAYLPLLEKSTAFRTNVGAVNAGAADCTVEFRVYGAGGSQIGATPTLSVPAGRWAPLNDLFAMAAAGSQSVAYATATPTTSGCEVWAYGSLIDNVTGDPTTVPMVVP